jgi:hypothetical protein
MLTSSPPHETTVASIWRGLAGIPITDEFLRWPIDLQRAQEFRIVVDLDYGSDRTASIQRGTAGSGAVVG